MSPGQGERRRGLRLLAPVAAVLVALPSGPMARAPSSPPAGETGARWPHRVTVAQGQPAPRRPTGLPVIVDVQVPDRLRIGTEAPVTLRFQAPGADVVAVILAVEDLDGGIVGRSTRQRELGVIARAFGLAAGELVVPLSFQTPGRKRVILTLVAEDRALGEPVSVEVEATP